MAAKRGSCAGKIWQSPYGNVAKRMRKVLGPLQIIRKNRREPENQKCSTTETQDGLYGRRRKKRGGQGAAAGVIGSNLVRLCSAQSVGGAWTIFKRDTKEYNRSQEFGGCCPWARFQFVRRGIVSSMCGGMPARRSTVLHQAHSGSVTEV